MTEEYTEETPLNSLDISQGADVIIPDLWQQQAIAALREGKDVVVQAPTGSGKTYIFESYVKNLKGEKQAVYTVPTRALANDKLAEWRSKGWNVGIATGDLSENLDAPVIVATLETQKQKIIRGEGPSLLVVDEYQMIRDEDRGLNYELALAMAPAHTQLLLLSGSVANPKDIVKWFSQLGRNCVLIKNTVRPVPLEEVLIEGLRTEVPSKIRGPWSRIMAKALAEELGPILIFAPRRTEAEKLAAELARYLPNPNPLRLTPEQKECVGENLARMLKSRIAYHHSGLAYKARAGVIEPLTKAGQLRIVVATMGLAAGINFSLRTVALAADSYKRKGIDYAIRPDEILQMFGRAGRRGIDKKGYVLTSNKGVRLNEAYSCHLSRTKAIDWSAIISVMQAAVDIGKPPFQAAMEVQKRLFTANPVPLGIENTVEFPDAPCGLPTDTERARKTRKPVKMIFNSRGKWQRVPLPQYRPLSEVFSTKIKTNRGNGKWDPELTTDGKPVLYPAINDRAAVENAGSGSLCDIVLPTPEGEENAEKKTIFGKRVPLADIYPNGDIYLEKNIRRMTNWNGRRVIPKIWESHIVPRLIEGFALQSTKIVNIERRSTKYVAFLDISNYLIECFIDEYNVPLFKPAIKSAYSEQCEQCPNLKNCKKLPPQPGAAFHWMRMGLVSPKGVPTLRGRIASFFMGGSGLAIAAAIEDEEYPIRELVYDLANLDAGFRFAGAEIRWGGRLSWPCQKAYDSRTAEGYHEHGIPPEYGFGAASVVEDISKNPENKYKYTTPTLGIGDIDRIIIEWRSRLRQVAHSPSLPETAGTLAERWKNFQTLCKETLNEIESPALDDLPELQPMQTRRLDHTLFFKTR